MASLFLAIIHYEQDLVHNGTKQTQLESWSGPSTQHNSPGTVSRCCDALPTLLHSTKLLFTNGNVPQALYV